MGEIDVLKLARKTWLPTSLSALVLFILFLILRAIISLNIFSTLSEEYSFRLLNNTALGLLALAALALILGVAAFVLTRRTLTLEGNTRFEDGTPVFGALVTIEGTKGEDTTNRNGYFEILAPSRDSWVIKAEYNHEVIKKTVTKEKSGDPIELIFPSLPQEKLAISGNVIFPDGRSVEGAHVHIRGKKGEELSNRIGYFKIEVDQSDSWILVAEYNGKMVTREISRHEVQVAHTLQLPSDGQDITDQKPSGPLPTFEIGECTEGSPFQMRCTGDIVRGIDAATRVVEEIEVDTSTSNSVRFDVRVAGIERIRSYLEAMKDSNGEDIEVKHRLRMALTDWEQHRSTFRNGVEYILWHSTLRKTSNIFTAEDAAEAICGLSRHCFGNPRQLVTWFLWYRNEKKTTQTFWVPEAVREFMETGYYEDDWNSANRRQGLYRYAAYKLDWFYPKPLHEYVLPNLLIYVSDQTTRGASQMMIDNYLDLSQWQWSKDNPDHFVRWK